MQRTTLLMVVSPPVSGAVANAEPAVLSDAMHRVTRPIAADRCRYLAVRFTSELILCPYRFRHTSRNGWRRVMSDITQRSARLDGFSLHLGAAHSENGQPAFQLFSVMSIAIPFSAMLSASDKLQEIIESGCATLSNHRTIPSPYPGRFMLFSGWGRR